MKIRMSKLINTLVGIAVFTAFLGVPNGAFGQIEVSGQVKDLETKENMPYTKVIAMDASDSMVRGAITDDKGFFKLPLNPGQYKIVISYYGYVNDTVQTGLMRADEFLGVFKLRAETVDFDEVKIEGAGNINTLEKDVQIITDIQKKGATATKDVLDKIPGISYDDYSGTLKVDNDANIIILVNGVEKNQEYVQNLEPERLLSVETTRDPGGRYGLEGYTAIVNVILKSDYKGTEVYMEEMQLIDIDPDRSRLNFLIGAIGGTFNYTRDELNIYASARIERRNFELTTESRTEYADGLVVLENALSTDPNANILEYNAGYSLGFDYRINPKHLVSFESNIVALPLSTEENTFEYQTEVFTNDTLIDAYDFSTKTKSQTLNTHNTLFYIGDFNKNNKLSVNFTYSNYSADYSTATLQEASYDRMETGINKKQYTRFYAEYDHTFSAKTSILMGYGNTWRELNNEYTVVQSDLTTGESVNFSDEFQLTDTRHKLYANFLWKLGKKWSTRFGIAAESSSPRVEGQKIDYLIYQPMFDLRFAAGKKLNLTFKYRTSSDYPTISEINPFVSQINSRITSTGNPFLTPSTVHAFSLRLNAFQGLISLEPYTQYSNNTVARVGEMGANDIFNYRYENVELYQRSGGKLNFSKYFKISLLVQTNVEVYHAKIVSTSGTNSFTDWRADADLIYIFKKSGSLLGLKYQRQQSKNISGLGYNKGDVDFWMLFYKQPLFKKKASIMFGYFLPIDLGANYNQDSHLETIGFMTHTDNNVSLVKNMFILEFSYRFNKGKSVKRNEKDVDQESEEGSGGMF
jgi:hypothetical protein